MNERVASPAECNLEFRIPNVSPVMHHQRSRVLADSANAAVPLNYRFPVSAEVPLRMVPSIVVPQTEPGFDGRLATTAEHIREKQHLYSH